MGGEAREPRRGTFSYFSRGAHEKSHDPDDYLLTHQKKQRLAKYNVLLRKFRYGDALDAVLAKRQSQAVRYYGVYVWSYYLCSHGTPCPLYVKLMHSLRFPHVSPLIVSLSSR